MLEVLSCIYRISAALDIEERRKTKGFNLPIKQYVLGNSGNLQQLMLSQANCKCRSKASPSIRRDVFFKRARSSKNPVQALHRAQVLLRRLVSRCFSFEISLSYFCLVFPKARSKLLVLMRAVGSYDDFNTLSSHVPGELTWLVSRANSFYWSICDNDTPVSPQVLISGTTLKAISEPRLGKGRLNGKLAEARDLSNNTRIRESHKTESSTASARNDGWNWYRLSKKGYTTLSCKVGDRS